MELRFSLVLITLGLMSGCGVFYTDNKTKRELHDNVENRVNQERVDANPAPGSHSEEQVVTLSLANAQVRDYTTLELIPGENYAQVACPATAPKSSLCVRISQSAELKYIVVGHYTQNRPLIQGGSDDKVSKSAPRSLVYDIIP